MSEAVKTVPPIVARPRAQFCPSCDRILPCRCNFDPFLALALSATVRPCCRLVAPLHVCECSTVCPCAQSDGPELGDCVRPVDSILLAASKRVCVLKKTAPSAKVCGQLQSLLFGRASMDVVARLAALCAVTHTHNIVDVGSGDGYACVCPCVRGVGVCATLLCCVPRYFAVALALLTGCTVYGVELVKQRCAVADSFLAAVWSVLCERAASARCCDRRGCASVRRRACGALSAAGHTVCARPDEVDAPMAPHKCTCVLFNTLPHLVSLPRRVTLAQGNALTDAGLPAATLHSADLVFCNNYMS